MATWAIGDLQGCLPELQALLEHIDFTPGRDQLWFCGDLVNRGGQSLEVLRLLHNLRDDIIITLGNHDLSLLAVAERPREAQARVNPELRAVLFAEDGPMLLDWLRGQKLLHYDESLNWLMVHAGLAPRWTLNQALRAASDVERELAGPGSHRLLKHLFGNHPATWTPRLKGLDRSRASINVLTRMRYCDTHGRIDFDAKGAPGSQRAGLYPWFAVPGMRQREVRVVFGHWSALGQFAGVGVHALDTGCVWGGRLTAMRLDRPDPEYAHVPAGPDRQRPAPPKSSKPRARNGAARPRRRRGRSRQDNNPPAAPTEPAPTPA